VAHAILAATKKPIEHNFSLGGKGWAIKNNMLFFTAEKPSKINLFLADFLWLSKIILFSVACTKIIENNYGHQKIVDFL
jgi:hypothetical protein